MILLFPPPSSWQSRLILPCMILLLPCVLGWYWEMPVFGSVANIQEGLLAQDLETPQWPFCFLCAIGRISWGWASQTGWAVPQSDLTGLFGFQCPICEMGVGHSFLIQPCAGRVNTFLWCKWFKPCSNTHTEEPDFPQLRRGIHL